MKGRIHLFCGKVDVHRPMFPATVLDGVIQDHMQNHQDIPDGFLLQAFTQKTGNKGLYISLADVGEPAESRNQVLVQMKGINGEC